MQEHDAPVDISAVPIRLMNHARLLKGLQRGRRQEAVNQDRMLTSVQLQ